MATSKMSLMVKKGDPESDRATKLKSSWNDFVGWLDKRGLKGNAALDRGAGESNVGIQYLRQYNKENPTSLATPENVKEIQSHFQNYRNYAINEIKNKRATYSGDVSKIDSPDSDFMRALSIVDGVPGSRTTSHTFPSSFLTTIYKDPSGNIEKTTKENTGLATTPTPLSLLAKK